MRRREFITLLGGAAVRGRSRRGRSRLSVYAASRAHAFLRKSKVKVAALKSKGSAIGLDRWPRRCKSTPDGVRPMRSPFADTWRS